MNKRIVIITAVIVFILTAALTAAVIFISAPNNEDIVMYDKAIYKAAADGNIREDVLVSGSEKYFSYDFIKTAIDQYIWLDEEAGIITVTNQEGITSIDTRESEDVLTDGGKIFLKEAFVSQIYKTEFQYNEENNITIIMNEEMYLAEAMPLKDELCIRRGPSIKEPRVKVVENSKGSVVAKVLEYTDDKWAKVIALTGEVGYIERDDADFTENEKYTGEFKGINTGLPEDRNNSAFKEEFKNKKINMVWEAVYSRNPNVEQIGEMEGLNVIAPTWFELTDTTGTIKNMADAGYVKWAHDRGYYVWGTVVSNTDYELTSAVLSNYEIRYKVINEILRLAKEFKLDGINIDFEYMYEEDKMLFTQFVRELSVLCHLDGLIVSCDVTPLSSNPKWSLCYDRKSLSASVDYMCVMFYDQHSGGGGKAGSVAQVSWVIKSLESILKQIPNDKLILGIPFYTRLWEEKEGEDGNIKVTSVVFNMKDSQELVREKGIEPVWDDESGQFYIEYEYEGALYKLWIEDESSVEKRVELVIEYNLAGCAAWRRNFETENIWGVIDSVLNEK